jgi:hypothetical protein
MAIGVPATACKHTPIGITTHITGLPYTLIRIVKPFGNSFIDGFIVNDRFRGFVGPGGIHIPVTFHAPKVFALSECCLESTAAKAMPLVLL